MEQPLDQYEALKNRLQNTRENGRTAARKDFARDPDVPWILACLIDKEVSSGIITKQTPAYFRFLDYAEEASLLIQKSECVAIQYRKQLDLSLRE